MPVSFQIPENLDRKKAYVWLASWFGCGFFKPAPGTWGSFGGLVCGLIIFELIGLVGLYIGIVVVTLIGLWASHLFDQAMDGHDSKMIVIDEVAGQWIAMAGVAVVAHPSLLAFFLSFLVFRFFDILKPWPVSFFDQKVKGAAGVMGDDIVAGLLAAAVMMGVSVVI